MKRPFRSDPHAVKKRSEEIILQAGGKICEWLPHLEPLELRPKEEIVERRHALDWVLHPGVDWDDVSLDT